MNPRIRGVPILNRARRSLATIAATLPLLLLGVPRPAAASTAYGTLNNFDCVNDTGVEAHGFDIEMDDVHSKDITYTYDYNHYGIPKITEDNSNPLHPKVLVRYASAKNSDGTWAAYTAVPAGPIAPTQGHQFTNPSVNFGGEHFGVGYYGAPTAVRYYWLVDDGTGNLKHGPPVYVSTPTFVYNPPVAAIPAQVVAVIVPPPPPVLPPLQFGAASWVKDIKTTSHNVGKVHLEDLVGDDPGKPQPWANGEPAEVETEWRIMQTEFAAANGGKNGELAGVPQDLPGGDEVVTRRYEFYKYIGPVDAETGEAMADAVGPDGIHGTGIVTYADHFDFATGEWVTVTVDLSTVEVVGDFFGAQMSGFDVAPALGLIEHVQDGDVNVAYPERTVVVAGGSPFLSQLKSGSLPDGLTFDKVTGILAGTPTTAGSFTFTIEATDLTGAIVSKTYTVTIAGGPAPVTYTAATSASPIEGGTTTGGGIYNSGDSVTVVASANAGYRFASWTEHGAVWSVLPSYTFNITVSRELVANFVRTYTVSTSASPAAGGTTTGDGAYDSGAAVSVHATENAGYQFANWTENGAVVSSSTDYTFNAAADRSLTANFTRITYTIGTSASPVAGGTTGGGGTVNSGASVTVVATTNAGYAFVNWTEGNVVVSNTASYTFTASANRSLVANFIQVARDVTPLITIKRGGYRFNRKTGRYVQTVTLTNKGAAITGPISLALDTLSANASLFNKTGVTAFVAPTGSPYIDVVSGSLAAKSHVSVTLEFTNPSNAAINYTTHVLAGPGSR